MFNVIITECHYAECHYAKCHNAECNFAEYHYTGCHYAEYLCAECHLTECHGNHNLYFRIFCPSYKTIFEFIYSQLFWKFEPFYCGKKFPKLLLNGLAYRKSCVNLPKL